MADINYKDIKDAIVYSKLYEKLSDKTDNINLKKRSVNSYILSNLCIGFAKEFDLNSELVELIVYARDIAYPTFGEITYKFLEQKNSNFNKLQFTIDLIKKEILEPNNMELPEQLVLGLADSFNIGENIIKEGRLVYLLEKTVYTAQMNREAAKETERFNEQLEEIWSKLTNDNSSTYDEICNNILLLTDTMIENEIIYGE